MMAISQCPHCHDEVRIPPDLFGSLVRCPLCYCEFVAPTRFASFAEAPEQSYQPGSEDYAEEKLSVENKRQPDKPAPAFSCPHCGATDQPRITNRISQAGWIVFAILLVFFWPLFWIGLLMKEQVKYCRGCGNYLGLA